MSAPQRTLPTDRNEWTAEETKDFLNFYASVLEKEAMARSGHHSRFAADLKTWAEKAREEGASIDLRPPQMELF